MSAVVWKQVQMRGRPCIQAQRIQPTKSCIGLDTEATNGYQFTSTVVLCSKAPLQCCVRLYELHSDGALAVEVKVVRHQVLISSCFLLNHGTSA